jgi:hypothetical protein
MLTKSGDESAKKLLAELEGESDVVLIDSRSLLAAGPSA